MTRKLLKPFALKRASTLNSGGTISTTSMSKSTLTSVPDQ
jgi:hypothetical protein